MRLHHSGTAGVQPSLAGLAQEAPSSQQEADANGSALIKRTVARYELFNVFPVGADVLSTNEGSDNPGIT